MCANSQFLCSCGRPGGFVDLGGAAANRYPCKSCYQAMGMSRPESQEYLSMFVNPAMDKLDWPSDVVVVVAEAKKKLLQNSENSS